MANEPPKTSNPSHMLGDKVAAVTSAVGVRPCSRCRKRKEALNALRLNQTPLQVAKDAVTAILAPEKALKDE